MKCITCSAKEAEYGKEECFRCRVLGVGFTFRGGGGYTRESFRDRTNTEFLNEHVGFDHKEQIRSDKIMRTGS
jgi:hypothetical protein